MHLFTLIHFVGLLRSLILMYLFVVLLVGGKSVALKTLTARNIATTESTDENASNQAGIGANAVSLIELKPTIDYSINKIENDYGLQFYNSTIKLLQEYN